MSGLLGLCILAGGCSDGSDGGGSGPASSKDPTATGGEPTADASVADGVAPYDYESARDATVLQATMGDRRTAVLVACVKEQGGLAEDHPLAGSAREDSDVEGIIQDFPDVERLIEDGRDTAPLIGVSIDPASYPNRAAFEEAMAKAGQPQFSEDFLALSDGCMARQDYQDQEKRFEPYDLLAASWAGELREIDMSDQLTAPRAEFLACVEKGGIAASKDLNEYSYWVAVDQESIDANMTPEQRAEHTTERGKLFGRCGEDLYALKEKLRKAAHDDFVEDNEDDIAALTSVLYGE